MSKDTFRNRLQRWFDHEGYSADALGIDLGTTKTCAAIASFDADSGELHCRCVDFSGAAGETGIAIPSAVAIDQGRTLVGTQALAKRGQKGFLPERTFFFETKNTIGLKYTYPNARRHFANATDIATHLLGNIRDGVDAMHGSVPDAPPVVACPASFHASQRRETVTATWRAFREPFCSLDDREDMPESAEDDDSPNARASLIDEPYAAFLDLLFREPTDSEALLQSGNTLMVFDFGGGTCDVALFRIGEHEDEPIGARLLATSRYHRLGGGDIDRAIVHEVLIPQVVKENGFGPWELTWADKSKRLEAALIDVAEALKIRISRLLAGADGQVRDLQAEQLTLRQAYDAGDVDDEEFERQSDALWMEQVAVRVIAAISGTAGSPTANHDEARNFSKEMDNIIIACGNGELSDDDYQERRRTLLLDQSVARLLARVKAAGGAHNVPEPKLPSFAAEMATLNETYENEGSLDDYEYEDKREALLQTHGEAHALIRLRAAQVAQNEAEIFRQQGSVSLPAYRQEVEIGGVARWIGLKQPTLDKTAFADLLKPFLDPEPPPESGGEYVQRSSIFSPVKQALVRAGLEPNDIDGVLLCGCSSLLPPVQEAIRKHFPNARCVLMGRSAEELQGSVARGAALQALAQWVLCRKLIAPTCSAELALAVTSGTVPLVRAGDTLPVQSHAAVVLHPPRASAHDDVDIAIEIVADGKQPVGRTLWSLPAPVSASDALHLTWKLDENQCLQLELMRGEDRLVQKFDSPVTHHDMSQVVRWRMLERMEAIRSGNLPRPDLGHVSEKIARDAAMLGEYERALHFVGVALQERGDEGMLLNLRGIYRQNIGDKDGAFEAYRKAAEQWSGARFNLALMHYRAGRCIEALKEVDAAIEDEPERAYCVLRGDILNKLGRNPEARKEWQDAIDGNIDYMALDEFDLGWLDTCAQRIEQGAVRDKIREARERKAQRAVRVARVGELPVYVGQPLRDISDVV
jgi:hypothetical protein